MFVMDLPDICPPQQSIVVAQNTSTVPVSRQLKIPKVVLEVPWRIGNDGLASSDPTSFEVDLGGLACTELRQDFNLQKLHWTSTTCKIVKIVTPPKHGSFASDGNGLYRYTPTRGLLGKDQVQFIVEGSDGRQAFVTLPILLQTFADAYSSNEFGNDPIAVWSQSNEPDTYAASWEAWLRAAIGDVSLSFANLSGDAIGNTADEGLNTTITLDNNIEVQQDGFAPVVVAAPSHGKVTANTDGTFSYTPEQDFFGSDSFTYMVSNGSIDSNVSTVSITVNPVNDAPLAQDGQSITAEDSPVIIDASSLTSDVDSATLAANDDALDSNPAEVVITVTAVNDAPVAT